MQISKRTRNAINNRLNATVKKYGVVPVRLIVAAWANKQREKAKVEKEIIAKKKELEALKRRR